MHYQIIIIGGGLVGSSLGLALGQLGFRVAIVEAFPPKDKGQPSFDSKAIALSHSSHNIFRQLECKGQNLWDHLSPYCNPIEQIHVSEQKGFGFTRLLNDRVGVPALGYVIENRDLGAELVKALEGQKTVQYLCPFTLETLEDGPDTVRVTIKHRENQQTETLTADLLVGADGGQSRVRELLGVGVEVTDYRQSAVITTIQAQRSHGNIAFERFTPHGPLALLPLTENRCSVVWTHSPEYAQTILQMDDQQFLQTLQEQFGRRLGKLIRVGKRLAFPLKLITARRCIGTRCVLIGNAAHTLHPIAGQGFNLGLRDVSVLAQVLAEGAHKDWRVNLQDYQQWQGRDQARIIAFTHGLLNVFSNDLFPLKLVRNTGLLLLDNFPPVKKSFAFSAMGMAGRMSLMARGVRLSKQETTS